MKNYHNEQGTCPNCGGTNLNYQAHELYDNDAYFTYHCEDCGQDGEEAYTLEFNTHIIYDDDGKQIEL